MSNIVGNTNAPSGVNFVFNGTSTGMLAGGLFTVPAPGGMFTAIHVWAGTASGSSASGYLIIWNGSGTVLGSVAVTIPGSRTWVAGTFATPFFIVAGTNIFIGFQVSGTAGYYVEYENGGTIDFGHNSTIPGAIANFSQDTSHVMSAYADYTPAGAYANTGSSGSPVWTAGEVFVNTGSSGSPVWTSVAGVFANTGSSGSPVWTPAG